MRQPSKSEVMRRCCGWSVQVPKATNSARGPFESKVLSLWGILKSEAKPSPCWRGVTGKLPLCQPCFFKPAPGFIYPKGKPHCRSARTASPAVRSAKKRASDTSDRSGLSVCFLSFSCLGVQQNSGGTPKNTQVGQGAQCNCEPRRPSGSGC